MAKSLAVLTSGGDAPGMNAAVRAVVRAGIYNGFKVYGVYKGYNGLLNHDVEEMNLRSVSDILSRGGTILYTARSKKFMQEEYQKEAADYCRSLGIEGLVVIGGDGSFRGARALTKQGIPCVGDIALETGIAVGATAIIVPEVEYDLERDVISRIYEQKDTGKKHFIVIVAEGVGGSQEISHYIQHRTGIETRATILGHVQRGGSPSLRDRLMATSMGVAAVELLKRGNEDGTVGNRVIGYRDGKIVDYDITEALEMPRQFNNHLYEVAMKVSI